MEHTHTHTMLVEGPEDTSMEWNFYMHQIVGDGVRLCELGSTVDVWWLTVDGQWFDDQQPTIGERVLVFELICLRRTSAIRATKH